MSFLESSRLSSSLLEEEQPPNAIRILSYNEEDHSHVLEEDVLSQLLLNPKYADKKVSIISVAGAFRKGKSFLLNFFLRYLTWLEAGNADGAAANGAGNDWLQSEGKLEGFSWRGGSERDTNGMLLWSHPFLIKNQKTGEEIVVLLMDTQGAFDTMSTVKECATIFALSTMLSSVQIYNLSQNIQEDDLQHLQLFTEYGKLALEECEETKPFQQLMFLVRDWSYPYDAQYGFEGGEMILNKRLEIHEKMHPELKQLRQQIRTSFENISSFLMAHPGLKVAQDPVFRGELSDIQAEFKENLKTFIPAVLDPSNIAVKMINDEFVTCRELLVYFQSYVTIFRGEDMPAPKSMLHATAEANNLAAVSSAKASYIRAMDAVCGGDTHYMADDLLEKEHARCSNDAIMQFKNTRKMGGTEMSLIHLKQLEEEMNEQYQYFIRQNSSKRGFQSFKIPAILCILLVIDYFLKEVFSSVGLNGIAAIFTSLCSIVVLVFSAWAYVRFSGYGREIGMKIEDAINWTWETILRQFMPSFFNEPALQIAAAAATTTDAATNVTKKNV